MQSNSLITMINTFNKLSGIVVPCAALGGLVAIPQTATASEFQCFPECTSEELETTPTLTKSSKKYRQRAYKNYQRMWIQNQNQWSSPRIYRQVHYFRSQDYSPKPHVRYDLQLRNFEESQRRSQRTYERLIQRQQRQLMKLWGM